MKIFIVFSDNERSIDEIFLEESLAINYCNTLLEHYHYIYEPFIEEYDVRQEDPSLLFLFNYDSLEYIATHVGYYNIDCGVNFCHETPATIYVTLCNDKKTSIDEKLKIATDRAAQCKAEYLEKHNDR